MIALNYMYLLNKKMKLTYFNSRGRAEVSRWMLKMSGTEFEDRRIEGSDLWKEEKPSTTLRSSK